MDRVRYDCSFSTGDFLLKIIVILEANLLICCQKLVLPFAKLIKVADIVSIDFVRCSRPNSPNLAQLLEERKLAIALQVDKFGHLALRQKLSHFFLYSITNKRNLVHLVSASDGLVIRSDVTYGTLVAHDLALLFRLRLI